MFSGNCRFFRGDSLEVSCFVMLRGVDKIDNRSEVQVSDSKVDAGRNLIPKCLIVGGGLRRSLRFFRGDGLEDACFLILSVAVIYLADCIIRRP